MPCLQGRVEYMAATGYFLNDAMFARELFLNDAMVAMGILELCHHC